MVAQDAGTEPPGLCRPLIGQSLAPSDPDRGSRRAAVQEWAKAGGALPQHELGEI